jgi:hypothetical protein
MVAGVRRSMNFRSKCFPSVSNVTAFTSCPDRDFTTAPALLTLTFTLDFPRTPLPHLFIQFNCPPISKHRYLVPPDDTLASQQSSPSVMMARTTTKISSGQPPAQPGKQETPHWLAQYLNTVSPPSQKENGEKVGLHTRPSMRRPRTAPSTGTATITLPMSPPLPQTLSTDRLSARQEIAASSRPDSGVLREVNAWLDASKPSSPLMGGLPYWRDGVPGTHTGEIPNVQYAISVVREPVDDKPFTLGSHQLKSFCRRAKRMQVRIPSLQRTRSQQAMAQKKINRRSSSTPVVGIAYEETRECSPPTFLTRLGSARRPATANAAANTVPSVGWFAVGSFPHLDLPLRRGSSVSTPFGGPGNNIERHFEVVSGQETRPADGPRPVLADASMPREDSMGSISDAPTYFSGPPPPSYRSRPASILTTSSFGCIDGMNPEYRQLSQQRAQEKRSVKGKLKRFAQKCALTK